MPPVPMRKNLASANAAGAVAANAVSADAPCSAARRESFMVIDSPLEWVPGWIALK